MANKYNGNRNNLKKRPNQVNREGNRTHRYNDTSSAYDYAYREYQQPFNPNQPVLSDYELRRKFQENRKKTYEKNLKERKRREHLKKVRLAEKVNKFNLILVSILMLYLAGTLVFVLNILDSNSEIKIEISQKQKIVDEQEKKISDSTIALANSVDIHQIEVLAQEELGMKLPSADQIVYVTLPKNRDYIEYEKENIIDNESTEIVILNDKVLSDSEKVEEIIENQNKSEEPIADTLTDTITDVVSGDESLQ